MDIVIVGAGKVGAHLTSQLSIEEHNILVIDKDKDVINRLLEQNDVMAIVGDGRDKEILEEANVANSDLFISLTMSDDVNILSSAIAKSLGAKNIIVRLRDPKYLNNYNLVRDLTSANMIINPEYLAAKDIQRSIKYSHARNVETFLEDTAMMIEVVVSPDSKIAGKTLIEADSYLRKFGVLIGVVNDNGDVVIPNGNFVIRPHHKVYVIGTKDSVDSFYKAEIPESFMIKDVLIIGASPTAYQLTALLLERNFNVTIIEIDKEKAMDIQDHFTEAIVIHADGSDPDILEEVRIEDFDSVISLTGIDEENILIALMAARLGIDKIIAKVNRTNLLKITGVLDIDATFTPKRAASNYIYRLIRSKEAAKDVSTLNNLYRIEDDQVEILEFEVSENSKLAGHPLRDLRVKDNTLVAAIDNKGITPGIEIANGNSIINVGDRVLIITKHKNFNDIDDILE